MNMRQAVCCALLLAFNSAGFAATAPKAQSVAKTAAKSTAKAGPKPLRGKTETLACRLGTEDRHARIAVVLIGGRTDSFAYYSKWKPRTCSIYLQRSRDMYSQWADAGALTTVNLERGAFLIEHKKNEYHFIFRDIDRERYCGMDGVINGSLTIKKGSDQCQLDGEIMVEGTALGEAFATREQDKPPAGLMPDSVPAAKATAETATAAPARAATAAQPASIADPGAASPSAAPAAGSPATAAAPAAKPATAPAAAVIPVAATPPAAAVPSEPVQKQAATEVKVGTDKPVAKADAEKKGESVNPISAFFKGLTTPRNPDGSPVTAAPSE